MTAPRFAAGAHLERRPGRKYVSSLRFAELALPSPVPRRATLARWRADLPEGFEVAVVAPKDAVASSAGPLRFDAAMEQSFARMVEAISALHASAVVIEHGAEVTTGQRDRDLLARWFDKLGALDGVAKVWAPSGLWEPDQAMKLATKIGAIYAVDPLDKDTQLERAPFVYARLVAMGGRMKFGSFLLEQVRDAIDAVEPEKARVAIRSERSFREARELERLFAAAPAEVPDDEELDAGSDDEDWADGVDDLEP